MQSIQSQGRNILQGNPDKLYIFCGHEYGVKEIYLDAIESVYGSRTECDSVASVLSSMRTKSILPQPNSLYIVRYDDAFIKSLDKSKADELINANIRGTLVIIYDDVRNESKVDKYLGNYAISFDPMSVNTIYKHISKKYPKVRDELIRSVCRNCIDYADGMNMAEGLSHLDMSKQSMITPESVPSLFGRSQTISPSNFRESIAEKNFYNICWLLERYSGDLNLIFYEFASTMVELEKCISTPYIDSNLKKYVKGWSTASTYTMFRNVYHSIKLSRTIQLDLNDQIIFLASLMRFNPIPQIWS